jgi:membrane-bound lytic murein transglycosylase B
MPIPFRDPFFPMRDFLCLALGLTLLFSGCSTQTSAPQAPEATRPEKATEAAKKAAEGGEGVILPPNPGIAQKPAVRDFIDGMVGRYGMSRSALEAAFNETGTVPQILDAMAKPYEAKPWYAYRKLFLTEKRINGGKTFMADNREAFQKAKSRYGVPPEMITAIIGIESAYGVKPGRYRVIDSLSTLAFDYPRRSAFFKGELEQFLLLCREEQMGFLEPQGSYAGAMGMPQFMPSSYRKLAADGDGDGQRDIWKNPADAIASVGNYFAKNGWHTGEPIAIPARVRGDGYRQVVSTKSPKLASSLAQLEALGITPEGHASANIKAGLLELQGESGPEYWIVFHNFNVIMRYNHSPLYAMAANELIRTWAHP